MIKQLSRLIEEIKLRVPEPRPPYTVGYLDGLRYVIEWLEENEGSDSDG